MRKTIRPHFHVTMLEDRLTPAVSGAVFLDYNANGDRDAADRGVAGVVVTGYDSNNIAVAQAVSDALGNYSLNPNASSELRVEFTNLPAGIFFGPQGTNSGSAVQFVAADASNVNLAVVRPEDIRPDNPTLVSNIYVVGGIEPYDLNTGTGVILSFPYDSGAPDSNTNRDDHQNPQSHELSVPQNQVGATWGLAYDAASNKLYAAAYMKRTTGWGPAGPGAIYSMNVTGTSSTLYADLNSIFSDNPAGDLTNVFTDNNGQPVGYRQGYDSADDWFFDGLTRFTDNDGIERDLGWDLVGKIALGGLDVNADGTRMFTVALGDRRLYSLPMSGALNSSTVTRFNLPVPSTVTGVTAENPLGDLRPFAVEWHRGLVYVGAVNSAESTQNRADLRAFVFAFDPATGQFVDRSRRATSTDAVFEFGLDYDRQNLHIGQDPLNGGGSTPPDPAEWNPWSPTTQILQQNPEALGRSGYPQPMLTGISFDSEGNMVIGLRDRSGDQIGRNVPIYHDERDNYSYFSVTAGDLLRGFINTPYNLDTSGTLSGWTIEDLSTEFYGDDDFPHDPSQPPVGYNGPENDEVSTGGVLQIPGFNQALSTSFDPVRIPGAINGGGVRWYDNSTGAISRSYELYVTPPASNTSTFAKGNGIGDLVAITGPAPIEIGNYAWLDTNRNGVQDVGETAMANVQLNLYDSAGHFLASAITDANGNYIFSSANGTSSTSHVYGLSLQASANYEIRVESVSGFTLTTATNDATFNGTARDSNASSTGIISVLTPGRGVSDHTYDVGFVTGGIVVPPPPPPPLTIPATVSGYVFRDDCPVDGNRQATERGIANVLITLSGDTVEGPVNLTTRTNPDGFYQFINLPPGTYTITETQVPGLFDGVDSLGNLGGNSPRNDVLQVTLAEDDDGVNYNFAEIAPNLLYGYVYTDFNRNGRFDTNEAGIRGVAITISGTAFAGTPLARPLTAADNSGTLTATTDANGRWEFPFLPPGNYTVREAQPGDYLDGAESIQSNDDAGTVVLGNDFFSSIGLCNGETRGLFNFGEQFPTSPQSPTKQDFLGSSNNGVNQGPSTTPPISTFPEDVPLDPQFSVRNSDDTYVVVASGAGSSPLLRVFDYASGLERFRFYAYERNYLGGVRVATGDVDGDGTPDIIAATGQGGGPRVRVFNGLDGTIIRDFFAYEPEFRGGVFVAAADVNGDGKAEIISGTELGGGPRVTVFDAVTNERIQDFFAFDSNQRGGVRVAAADFNRDGKAEIVTTAGRGVQTRVRIFDAASRTILSDFIPYDPTFTGGVFISAGDVTGDGIADVVTSADVGGGPHVQVFDGLSGRASYGFFAGDPSFRGGVRVTLKDIDGNGLDDIVAANGPGGTARVRIYLNGSLTPAEDFYAFDTTFASGIYVG